MRTRNRWIAAVTPVLALLLAAPCLDARQVETERQVPVLPDQDLLEISPDLRSRAGLFPDAEGFRTARLFLREDGGIVLEIESIREGRVHRERRHLSQTELTALRDDVAARFAAADGRALTLEGRGGFVLGHTLLGLGFHGWAVPVALDIDSAQAAVGSYLLTAGVAFLVPYRLSRNRDVTEAHRDLSLYGGTRGILHGVLLGDALQSSDADAGRIRLAGGILASASGSTLGFWAADRFRPDDGRAALWGVMGDFGTAAGAGTAYVTGPYASRRVERSVGDHTFTESVTRNAALGHAMTVAGGAAGLLAGGWMGGRQTYTEGNATVLRSAGILGAQAGVTLARTATREGRGLAAGAVVGGIGGIAGGHRLLRDQRLSTGEGLLVSAGHLAGGATALGLTYLVVEEIDDHPLLYLATSTAGSILGAALVYRAVDDRPGSATGLRDTPSGGHPGAGARSVTLTLHPENLLASWMTDAGSRATGPVTAPLVTVRF